MRVPIYIALGFTLLLGSTLGAVFSFPYISDSAEDYQTHLTSRTRKPVHLLFVGDMMFDRQIRKVAQAKGYDFLFSCVHDELQKYDLIIGNLEGPITTATSTSMGSVVGSPENFTFTFSPEVAPLLARQNIRLVNLGNNHMLNFSRNGLIQTKQFLDAANVMYFGDPDSVEEKRVRRISLKGTTFAFVNWSDWTSDKTDHTAHQIKLEAEAGRTVVVYTHWGDEYAPPPARVRALAHQFIDMGATLVVGSHPHIVQEHEVYNGKHIYYSLGNFIFDQYWNKEVSEGLTLEATFLGKDVAIQEVPVQLKRDGTTCFIEN